MAAFDSNLIDRLEAIRRTVRLRLVAYGLTAVLSGGVAAFLTIVAADWLFWFPPALRMLAAMLFMLGLVMAITHWIVKPLSTPMSIDQIAGTLEQHFGELNDRLSSTINFLKHESAGSPALVHEVISNTDRVVRKLHLERALTLRPLLSRLVVLLLAGSALSLTFVASPDWAMTGFYRYLDPLGDIEWPRRVEIVPLTTDVHVAVGESATVELTIQRGLNDVLRPVVYLHEKNGRVLAQAMHAGSENRFSATIDAITEDMTYWFEAGDDSTKQTPFTIRAVSRPEVVDASLTIQSPSYADFQWTRTHRFSDGPVSAPQGGIASVSISTNKPLFANKLVNKNSSAHAVLQFDNGQQIPLSPTRLDPLVLTANFDVSMDVRFIVDLADDLGFTNRNRKKFLVKSYKDQPPSVTIEQPAGDVDLTPNGIVSLQVTARDDYGIESLTLEARHLRLSKTWTKPLPSSITSDPVRAVVVALSKHEWSMDALSVEPGDTVTYSVIARDNFPANADGQVGRSATLRINIISEVEFDIRVGDEVASLTSQIRQILLEQNQALQETISLANDSNNQLLDTRKERQAQALARRQSLIVTHTQDLAQRFMQLDRRISLNVPSNQQASQPIRAASLALETAALEPMTQAANQLVSVRQTTNARRQAHALDNASVAQEDAVVTLRNILNAMAQFGGFGQVLAKTKDLLDRQDDIVAATAKLERTSLGKPIDVLTPKEATQLKRLSQQQTMLKTDAESFLAEMKKLARTFSQKEPAGAQAIDAALRAARSLGLLLHLETAATAINANRTSAASIDQKAASSALREMIKALRSREKRKLELLEKRLHQAKEMIAQLLEDQRSIESATRKAVSIQSDKTAWQALSERQRRLRRNTELATRDLEAMADALQAARLVGSASATMKLAEQSLYNQQNGAALDQQDNAIELLEQAMLVLDQASNAASQALLRQTLADMKESLQQLRDDQQSLLDQIETLMEAAGRQPRLSRASARKASRLSRKQAQIHEALDKIMPDLKNVPVYHWALERVALWMSNCQTWLSQRKLDDDLKRSANRIVQELNRLIRAIEQTQAMPFDTEFAEAKQGGGGGGQSRQSTQVVPTLAELIVLKTMQLDINDRTKRMSALDESTRSSENHLKELETLGEDQSHVRRLTEMVTEKARKH